MYKLATPKGNKEARVNVEEFITLFNNDEAVLVDVRMSFEKKVWNLPFALDIPADKTEELLDTLPKDKLIVTACPTQNRSPFVAMYLQTQGFNAKYLEGGLSKLMERLKGGKAKDLSLGK